MRVVSVLPLLIAVGCATLPPPPVITPALDPVPVAEVQRPEPPPQPPELVREEPVMDPIKAITRANARALMTPKTFVGGMVIYPFRPGAIYALYSTPLQPIDIVLQRGEKLLKIGKVNDKRWLIDHQEIDEGESDEPTHIYIMPTMPQIKTTLPFTTTKGLYTVRLLSHPTTGMIAVSWQHPPTIAQKPASVLPTGVYYLGYSITPKKGWPDWTPLCMARSGTSCTTAHIWDTGASGGKTLIQFPEILPFTEAPVLYVLNHAGQRELVNYRMIHKTFFLIDRLFDTGELRVGVDNTAVITIQKASDYRAIRCPGSSDCPPLPIGMSNTCPGIGGATRVVTE